MNLNINDLLFLINGVKSNLEIIKTRKETEQDEFLKEFTEFLDEEQQNSPSNLKDIGQMSIEVTNESKK